MATNAQQTDEGFRFRLDPGSGVPAYRQLIDQVLVAIASGALGPGRRLPTVRQVSVDLAINPNTVVRAYKELEIRGILSTQQGTGTFIAENPAVPPDLEKQKRLNQIAAEAAAKVGAEGLLLDDLIAALQEMRAEHPKERN